MKVVPPPKILGLLLESLFDPKRVQSIDVATAMDAAVGLLNPGVNGTITGWGVDGSGR